MHGVWTVARHTFTQALRMKIAGVFIILLAVSLTVLPFITEGDGTLAGQIRTFLAYSTGISAILLSLITIFIAVAVITSDVRGKQVLHVATKPLPRWQYILGRWLGVVVLDICLLFITAVVIYALAQHMRGGRTGAADRQAIESEIFTSRVRVNPESFEREIDRRVEGRIKRLKESGGYEDAVEAYRQKYSRKKELAHEKLFAEIRKQESQAMRSVRPGGTLFWRFSGIDVAGKSFTGKGQIQAISRELQIIRIKADPKLSGKLIYYGPVRVANVDAAAVRITEAYFDAMFSIEDMKRSDIANLQVGKEVSIQIDPTIQISYKARAAGDVPGGMLHRIWQVINPQDGYTHFEPPRSDPVDLPATITLSARVVSDDGRTTALYVNRSPISVTMPDISLLYRVGDFEVNFFKAMLLILCQLIFLSALGVMTGSFLSFPVACLMSFGILPFSLMRGFLTDSLKLGSYGIESDVLTVLGHYILKVMSVILPDFAGTSPGDSLVDGMQISWGFVGQTSGIIVGVQTVVILLIACLIFHKRELARVQV